MKNLIIISALCVLSSCDVVYAQGTQLPQSIPYLQSKWVQLRATSTAKKPPAKYSTAWYDSLSGHWKAIYSDSTIRYLDSSGIDGTDSSNFITITYFNNHKFRWQRVGEGATWQTDSLSDSAGYAEITSRTGNTIMHRPDTSLLAMKTDLIWKLWSSSLIGQNDTSLNLSFGTNMVSPLGSGTTIKNALTFYNNTNNTNGLWMWGNATASSLATDYFVMQKIGNQLQFVNGFSGYNGKFSFPVGIGATPVNQLDVAGAAVVGSYAGINALSSGYLAVSGSIGAGTSTPQSKIHSLDANVPTFLYTAQNGGNPLGGAVTAAGNALYGATQDYYSQLTTTDATQQNLVALGIDSSVYFVNATILGKKLAGNGSNTIGCVYQIKAAIQRVGASSSLIGTIDTSFVRKTDANWNATLVNVGSGFQIKVIGVANTTITWDAIVHMDKQVGQ